MRQLKITQQITHRDDRSVNLYFQEVNKYPMISSEEEVELAVRIKNGDDGAMRKLVEANLRFVISVAKQYQNMGLSFADLINEGNMGLVIAARKFDETRGFKFISYAVWWIRQSIMQAVSEQTRIVRLPVNRLSAINKISKAIPQLEQRLEREPTNSELADYLEEDEKQVETNNIIKRRHVSFDKPLVNDGESDFSLYDLVPNEHHPSPENQLLAESMQTDILRALEKLNEREYYIITLFYGLNRKRAHNLHEIADLLNMSGERVRQLKSSGILKLKKILSGNPCFCDNF